FVFGALPAPGTATLATLPAVFGAADEVSRALLFRAADDSDLVDDGTKVETSTILNSVPTFLVSCAGILAGLTMEQEALVYLDPGVFGVLVDETGKLVARKKLHDDNVRAEKSGQVAQEAGASSVARDAALLRERTRAGLVSALGSSRRTLIDTAAGTSTEDPALVGAALDALADLLSAVHDPKVAGWTDGDRSATDRFCVGSEQITALRAAALAVGKVGEAPARPTRSVTQRALDLQDGRVLLLVEMIVRALRQAHRASTAIAMPDLKQLAWKFSSRSGKRPKKGDKAMGAAKTAALEANGK
ncbi:MAG: hypothetical protein ACMG6S_36825, partial [Byssovorax sp.]